MVFGHDFLKGGFVGVDIFFVISGYLISRILLSELFEKGKISFLQFYERRARRILPILFTVFIVSFPLAYKYLMPHQFVEYAHSILSATFFGSNIFFYFTNTQYGAEDSLLQPFLHTWSLGVEEQFYILIPIVLILANKFAKNHLVTIITILILISLTYANWQSTENMQLNFFMLTSRLWELGIGSLLAFYELKYGRVKHELLNQTMPLLGLAMIAYAIVFFNNQTPHPSFITLLPTLGTALIILYSINKTDWVGKVLSWKPIVGIGLISYSMYLWHYPIFAFARIGDLNGLHNDEKYLLIFLTIVLSVISYFLIEKPFRNTKKLSLSNLNRFILVSIILVYFLNNPYLLNLNKQKYQEFKDKYTYFEKPSMQNKPCHSIKKSDPRLIQDSCVFTYNINNPYLILLGDSQADSLSGYLWEYAKQNSLNFIQISEGFPGKFSLLNNNKNLFKYLDQFTNIHLVISQRYPLFIENQPYKDDREIEPGFRNKVFKKHKLSKNLLVQNAAESIQNLSQKVNKLYLIYPVPEQTYNPASKFFVKNIEFSTPLEHYDVRTKSTYQALNNVNSDNIIRIYPREVFCDDVKKLCFETDEFSTYYASDNHLSDYGTKKLLNKYFPLKGDINSKN